MKAATEAKIAKQAREVAKCEREQARAQVIYNDALTASRLARELLLKLIDEYPER